MDGSDHRQDFEDAGAYGAQLGSAFRLTKPAAFINRNLQAGLLAVTEIRHDNPEPFITPPLPAEDAFLATVQVRDFSDHQAWEAGKMYPVLDLKAGTTMLRDLKRSPSALIDKACHSLHFYMPRAALEMIADDADARRVDELRYEPGVSVDDGVIHSLSSAMLGAFELPGQANLMFLDHMMMAVATHVATTYGGLKAGSRPARGGLNARQERRAKEVLSAHLGGDVPLQTVAEECGVSISHFRRAFRESTGMAPHQWLLHRRVEVAKDMLERGLQPLTDIALSCGFADQSHFTRVFTRIAGVSPGRWRRRRDPGSAGVQ